MSGFVLTWPVRTASASTVQPALPLQDDRKTGKNPRRWILWVRSVLRPPREHKFQLFLPTGENAKPDEETRYAKFQTGSERVFERKFNRAYPVTGFNQFAPLLRKY